MTTFHFLITNWNVNIPLACISALLILLHLWTNGKQFTPSKYLFDVTRKSLFFFSGIVLLLVVSQSPIDLLGRYYLFSAHMFEHVIFLLIVPPLLLIGTDEHFILKTIERMDFAKYISTIFKPSVMWMFGVGGMWFLHIPAIFIAFHHSSVLMTLQMIGLLVLGIIFIWPVYSPLHSKRLPVIQRVIYLFTSCVGCSVLGILITFTSLNLYDSCMIGLNDNILHVVRSNWCITPEIDQQFGGLIMWLPTCLIYLTNIMITLFHWYESEESGNKDRLVTTINQ